MAAENVLGEIGNVILSRPELLDGVDPRIARLFRWHGYEEAEHKAVLFDAFHAARGRGLYTYTVRIAGLWIAVVLLAVALPSVSYRILASAGAAQDLHAGRDLLRFVFGRGGMLRGRWRAIAAYHSARFPPVAVSRQPALLVGTPRHDRRSRMGGQRALNRRRVALVSSGPAPRAMAEHDRNGP